METASLLLQTSIMLYLIIGEPWLGKREYMNLVRSSASDPNARIHFYQKIMAVEWGLTALVVLLYWPGGKVFSLLGLSVPPIPPVFAAVLVALMIGLAAPVVAIRLSEKARVGAKAQLASMAALLPVTRKEQWWYAGVSLTAGICEEILFRGFIIAYLSALVPSVHTAVLLVVSAIIFGMAHLYQGWKGVLGSGVMGLVFGVLYLVSGSLLLPIALHALIDLRILALLPALNRTHTV